MKNIILGAIVIIIIYSVYNYFFVDHTVANLVGLHNAKKDLPAILDSSIPKPRATNFTYSIWLYINSFDYKHGHEKIIFTRGEHKSSEDKYASTLMKLDQYTNDLVIIARIKKDGEGEEPHECIVKNIPIQKWTHVLFSQTDQSIDVYLDGKLVKTCMLPNAPVDPRPNLYVCPKENNDDDPGFSGYTSKLRYFGRNINPREAYSIYREGPEDSLGFLSNYKLKFSFLNGSEEVSSVTI